MIELFTFFTQYAVLAGEVAQLGSVLPPEREVLGLTLCDPIVGLDFLLIRVALALSNRETEDWQNKRGGGGRLSDPWPLLFLSKLCGPAHLTLTMFCT